MRLSSTVKIDLPKLIESRGVVQANSGGGKSWTCRRIIEQSFGEVPIIVIDPEGEYGNLRAEYDFIYIGKDGDAPAESRSAALLARRLLETKASAIIDIFELPPQERKHFVKVFFNAMIDAPKELWNDTLILLDEAHKFAPEKEQSEALEAVSDMASRGRKRGFCLIAATQRPAKLNKDVAAELNNKLIGRASLDIDRKRSAEELGFTSKEEVLSLRNLDPGEFYAFGPAIGSDIVKTKIGDLKVPMPKRGEGKKAPPQPTEKVKKLLAQFKDLPAEAKQEAQTTQTLLVENTTLKRQVSALQAHKCPVGPDPEKVKQEVAQLISKAKVDIEKSFDEELRRFKKKTLGIKTTLEKVSSMLSGLLTVVHDIESEKVGVLIPEVKVPSLRTLPKPTSDGKPFYNSEHTGAMRKMLLSEEPYRSSADNVERVIVSNEQIAAGELAVLKAIAMKGDEGATREYVTQLTGYKTSTRNTYIQRLLQKAYVVVRTSGRVSATQMGINILGADYEPLPTGQALIDHLMRTLPDGEKKVLEVLISQQGAPVSRDTISEITGYKTSTRNTYIQRLASRELVEASSDGVAAAQVLFI